MSTLRAIMLGLAISWAASIAQGQAPLPTTRADPALVNALAQPGRTVDTVLTWPVDWDGTPPGDLLVQVGYANASGGNAIMRVWRIVTPTAQGPILGAPFALPGAGIKTVQPHASGAFLTLYEYRAGDPRCCPSGTLTTILSRGTP